MAAPWSDQWRQRDPVERDKATTRQSWQLRKCLMARIENHSSSSGSLDRPGLPKSSNTKAKPMELLAFQGV
jgi:hypothetical protein